MSFIWNINYFSKVKPLERSHLFSSEAIQNARSLGRDIASAWFLGSDSYALMLSARPAEVRTSSEELELKTIVVSNSDSSRSFRVCGQKTSYKWSLKLPIPSTWWQKLLGSTFMNVSCGDPPHKACFSISDATWYSPCVRLAFAIASVLALTLGFSVEAFLEGTSWLVGIPGCIAVNCELALSCTYSKCLGFALPWSTGYSTMLSRNTMSITPSSHLACPPEEEVWLLL